MQTIQTRQEQTTRWQARAGNPIVVCTFSLNKSAMFYGGKLGRNMTSSIDNRQIRQ